jgi:prepilin-type N-terminal cleavage/methylation domain-containing protein
MHACDNRGLTLVEVVIGIAILVIGVFALLGAVSGGYMEVVTSGGQSRATAHARQILEQFRNQPFPGPADGGDSPESGVTRTWTRTVTGTAPNRLARFNVRVDWTRGPGLAQTIVLETLRAE